MTEFLQHLRFTIRFVAALTFWLHAFFLVYLPRPSIAEGAARLGLNLSETVIILAIGVLSILSSYGWKKFLIDLLYIYVFPFIALYMLGKLMFHLSRLVFRLFRSEEGMPSDHPLTIGVQPESEASSELGIQQEPERKQISQWKRGWKNVARPFNQFTLLWCLLLLLSSNAILLWTALIIVLIHLLRSMIKVIRLVFISVAQLEDIDKPLRTYVERLLEKLHGLPKDSELSGKQKTVVNSLTGIQITIRYLHNKRLLARWVMVLGVLTFVAAYVYLAFLFGFAYYGVARVQSIQYTWLEAFVTSAFIPVAFADLPQNVWLKLLGGIHWLVVTVLGVGAIFGYLQRKVDKFHGSVEALRNMLDADETRKTLEELGKKAKTVPPNLDSI